METELENQFLPDWVSAPGETIRDLLDTRGMSVMTFACRMNQKFAYTLRVLSGEIRIDEGMAEQLERVIGGTKAFWLSRDQRYVSDCKRLGETPGRRP